MIFNMTGQGSNAKIGKVTGIGPLYSYKSNVDVTCSYTSGESTTKYYNSHNDFTPPLIYSSMDLTYAVAPDEGVGLTQMDLTRSDIGTSQFVYLGRVTSANLSTFLNAVAQAFVGDSFYTSSDTASALKLFLNNGDVVSGKASFLPIFINPEFTTQNVSIIGFSTNGNANGIYSTDLVLENIFDWEGTFNTSTGRVDLTSVTVDTNEIPVGYMMVYGKSGTSKLTLRKSNICASSINL